VGAVEGAVFGLLGLLVAFTFSGAAARLDARRELVVEEANDIGTAYLRLDMLPPSAQPALRDLFRRYLDARLEVYRRIPDLEAVRAALAHATALQHDIWVAATAACRTDEGQRAGILLLPALNAMFDVTTTRTAAGFRHPPMVIYWMLVTLALGCALFAGYGMGAARRRSWVHILGFAAVMAGVVYVILDLEYPRIGLIRMDAADRVLEELRASMGD
jgi:hypothetical protein